MFPCFLLLVSVATTVKHTGCTLHTAARSMAPGPRFSAILMKRISSSKNDSSSLNAFGGFRAVFRNRTTNRRRDHLPSLNNDHVAEAREIDKFRQKKRTVLPLKVEIRDDPFQNPGFPLPRTTEVQDKRRSRTTTNSPPMPGDILELQHQRQDHKQSQLKPTKSNPVRKYPFSDGDVGLNQDNLIPIYAELPPKTNISIPINPDLLRQTPSKFITPPKGEFNDGADPRVPNGYGYSNAITEYPKPFRTPAGHYRPITEYSKPFPNRPTGHYKPNIGHDSTASRPIYSQDQNHLWPVIQVGHKPQEQTYESYRPWQSQATTPGNHYPHDMINQTPTQDHSSSTFQRFKEKIAQIKAGAMASYLALGGFMWGMVSFGTQAQQRIADEAFPEIF